MLAFWLPPSKLGIRKKSHLKFISRFLVANQVTSMSERRAPEPKHHRFWVLLCAPHGCSLLISFLFSLLFVLVCVALQMKLLSLRYHPPRLCRIAVFLIQTIVLSHEFMRYLPVRLALKTVNPGIAMPTTRLPYHLGGLGLAPMVQFSFPRSVAKMDCDL